MNIHELEAVRRVLKRALARGNGSTPIRDVHLVLGEAAELDQGLLKKYWTDLSQGTPAEHARLHFRLIKAEVQCMACFSKYQPLNGKIHCPHCGSYGAKILSGEEFDLDSIELVSEDK